MSTFTELHYVQMAFSRLLLLITIYVPTHLLKVWDLFLKGLGKTFLTFNNNYY